MGLTFLVDKSVLGHLGVPAVSDVFRSHLDAGRLGVSTVTLLEQRISDRSPADSRRFDRLVMSKAGLVEVDGADITRAREVQALLVAAGEHRGPGIPDLLVAATAERHDLTVLHIDHDFETIARHTGQPTERAGEVPSRRRPRRPPRGTGIVQQVSSAATVCPRVVCAHCRDRVRDLRELVVMWHTDDGGHPLEGRLAFAHTECADEPPLDDYGQRTPGRSWLVELCRGLDVPPEGDAVVVRAVD